MEGLMLHAGASHIGRQDLLALPVPEGTETHKVIPHPQFVESIIQALAYRKMEVVKDEYGISKDGMNLFGALTLNIQHDQLALVIGIRNSHNKMFSLGIVAGFRVFVCDNLAFNGEFEALARKHTKNLDLVDTVALGVDRVQRQFDKMVVEIDAWKDHKLPDVTAKSVIFDAFTGGDLEAPRHLDRVVAHNYFEPEHDEFKPRTLWSLQNAFTEAFKQLEPVPQFRATASLGEFFKRFN